MLFAHYILSNVCCIVFVASCASTACSNKYALDLLASSSRLDRELVSLVATCCGGDKKEMLSEVECALLKGTMRELVSTNAMELGVDTGGLDCTLNVSGER